MKNLFIILTLLPLLAFSQQKAPKNMPYAIDLIYSPDSYALPKAEINTIYYPEFSYRTGINYTYNFHNRWSFRTGLRYTAYNRRFEVVALNTQLNTYNRTITNQKAISYEWPLFLRFYLFKKKWAVYSEIGGNLDFKSKEDVKKIRHLPFTLGVSFGLEYQINHRFGLFMQPTYHRPFSNNYPFSIGLESGVKLRIQE
jgi:hypothetical protein